MRLFMHRGLRPRYPTQHPSNVGLDVPSIQRADLLFSWLGFKYNPSPPSSPQFHAELRILQIFIVVRSSGFDPDPTLNTPSQKQNPLIAIMVNNKNGRAAFKKFLSAFPSPNFAQIKQSIKMRFSRSGSKRLRSVVGRPPTPYADRSENDLGVIDSEYEESYEMQSGLRQPFIGSSDMLFEPVRSIAVDVARAGETSSSAHDPAGTSQSLDSGPSEAAGGVENPRQYQYPRLRHPLRIPPRLSGTRHGQDTSPTQSGPQRPTLRSLYQEGQHNGQYPPQPWSGSGINTIEMEEIPRQVPDGASVRRLLEGPRLQPDTLSTNGYRFYNMFAWRQDEDEEFEASEAEDPTSLLSEEVMSEWRELREAARVNNRLDRNGRRVSDSDGDVFPDAAVLSMIT